MAIILMSIICYVQFFVHFSTSLKYNPIKMFFIIVIIVMTTASKYFTENLTNLLLSDPLLQK